MLFHWIVTIAVIVCVTAEENRWVWGKNHRSQRAYNNGNVNYYGRERDREPTTKRPPIGQTTQEDYLNPDDLRNYNGSPNFGYPSYGPGIPSVNNYPGYGPQPGLNPQGSPNNRYPTQPNYSPNQNGGYPGLNPQVSNNGFQNSGAYPNQGFPTGYPQSGLYPDPSGSIYPGFPGLTNILGLNTGYPGQGGFTGQNQIPGFGGNPYQPSGYPSQGGFLTQPNYPSQYPGGNNYPQTSGQYPIGQYGQYPIYGQSAQYPGQYPGQYPYPYPGQYPFPSDPYTPQGLNPFGVTPYNSGTGLGLSPDDTDDTIKNGTNNTDVELKAEGKSFIASVSDPKSFNAKLQKHKKT